MIKKSIPSFITLLNLVCGLLAILTDDLRLGVFLIVLGGIFDVFDGLVARLLNTTSEIGKQLDSLADVVSFGLAPAVLFYKSFNGEFELLGILAPIFIVMGGALRLARFNVTTSNSNYFEGLAIPASGLLISGLVLAHVYQEPISKLIESNILYVILIGLMAGLLNVSKIKMFSLKQLKTKKIVRIYFSILGISTLVYLYFMPFSAIPLILCTYIFLALVDHLVIKSELR